MWLGPMGTPRTSGIRTRRGRCWAAVSACAAGLLACAWVATADAAPPRADHECHLLGLVFHDGPVCQTVFEELSAGLYRKTLPQDADRESPSRDGWGFGYFLAPPHAGIERPMLIKAGPPACEDSLRWAAAITEIEGFALGAQNTILGHVRKSSYGPDHGALPDPHPFADSLMGKWWLFSHNGHMVPDTLLSWIPAEFLTRHPLDYDEIWVDSEILFRYCQYEIERLRSVRAGLLFAFHRVKSYDDFVFNICLTDGDTLWAAHTLSYTPFYYAPVADSTAWWVSTVSSGGPQSEMAMHGLYWFTPGAMGSMSYE